MYSHNPISIIYLLTQSTHMCGRVHNCLAQACVYNMCGLKAQTNRYGGTHMWKHVCRYVKMQTHRHGSHTDARRHPQACLCPQLGEAPLVPLVGG